MASLANRPLRLRRLDRVFARDPVYFVTFCTHQRAPVLACDALHTAFREFCQRAGEHGFFVGRYVLMPDHLHFFVAASTESRVLSTWIKSMKNALSKTLRILCHPSPHWQKGFFDHVLRSAEYYSEKWDYVRANPVRAGLVSAPEAWSYQGTINDLSF